MTTPDKEPSAVDGFRLLKRIGRGGMATVYKAVQVSIGRIVAVKILHPQYAADAVFVSRFQREARAAARLNHPNIVSGIDVGESEGRHYFAMEYVEGRSLARALREDGPMTPKAALGVVTQIARALEHAHAYGMVHLDIKPGNIMLTPEGHAKLADFGLARRVEDDDELYNERRLIFGTPGYMPPEQLKAGAEVDIRADIYSLGVTFYEMLSGRCPFSASTRKEIVRKVLTADFEPLSVTAPKIPADLAGVVTRMFRHNRDERYQTPAELLAALEKLGSDSEAPPRPPQAAGPEPAPAPPPAARMIRFFRRALLGLAPALAAAVVSQWLDTRDAGEGAGPPARERRVADEYARVARDAKNEMLAGRYAEAARLLEEFAGGHPSSRWTREAEQEAEKARQAARRAEEEATRAAELARQRTAAAPAREPGGHERAPMSETAALQELERALPSLREAGRFREGLDRCNRILQQPGLAGIHNKVRDLREPFLRICGFLSAVLKGAEASSGEHVRVGGDDAFLVGVAGERLLARMGGRVVEVELKSVAAADLETLARRGGEAKGKAEADAALTLEAWGDFAGALEQSEAAAAAGRMDEMTAEVQRNALLRLAREAMRSERWKLAEAFLRKLTKDSRHRAFVYWRREQIRRMEQQVRDALRFQDMALVPGGLFMMRKGRPKRVAAFLIDKHEVTVAQYSEFVAAVQRYGARKFYGWTGGTERDPRPKDWNDMLSRPQEPVTGIDWYDASAYAKFAGKRLPTCEEWEKAARGIDGFRYPWGDTWQADACNCAEAGLRRPEAVGQRPKDRSPYGCVDMAGNVREWVADSLVSGKRRIVKGGSFASPPAGCDATLRNSLPVDARDSQTGFRCAADAE